MSKIFEHISTIAPTFSHVTRYIDAELTRQGIPVSMTEIEEGVKKQDALLKKYFDINLTSKKKNKSIDFYCENSLGIDGGFQSVRAAWKKVGKEAIESLIAIKNMPEDIYLSRCDTSEELFILSEDSDIDLSMSKHNFNSPFKLIVDINNQENINFTLISETLLNNLKLYALNDVGIQGGTGFGSERDDMNYIKEQYGITPYKNNYPVCYSYSCSRSLSLLVMHLVRPTNENIDMMISLISQ